jgi:hypothetical protein
MRYLLPAIVSCLAVAVVPAASAQSPPCRGNELAGAFSTVRGSAGAGQITYRLRVVNHSRAACFLSGIPRVRLLGLRWKPLPTRAVPAFPGALTAVRVELAPGAAAALTARFSPDVPGVGEPRAGRRCEPVAYRLLVTPSAGGTLPAKIVPPTPVCEHGRLELRAFTRSR